MAKKKEKGKRKTKVAVKEEITERTIRRMVNSYQYHKRRAETLWANLGDLPRARERAFQGWERDGMPLGQRFIPPKKAEKGEYRS